MLIGGYYCVTTALLLRYTSVTTALLLRYTSVTTALLLRYTSVTTALLLRYTSVTTALHKRYYCVTTAFFMHAWGRSGVLLRLGSLGGWFGILWLSVWGPYGVGVYPVISSQYILLILCFSIRLLF